MSCLSTRAPCSFALSCVHLSCISKFDLIHCDIWTSPVVSISGYKYYLVILSTRLLTSSPTPPLNLALASKLCSATMGESLTTPAPYNSSSPRAFTFACPALTPRLKKVKLNELFALSIMLFAPCSFRHPCLPPTGWRPFPRRLFFSTYCPPIL